MLLTRLGNTLETKYDLLATITTEMEPCILDHGLGFFDPTDAEGFFPAVHLEHLPLRILVVDRAAKPLQILVDEAIGHLHIVVLGEVEQGQLLLTNMFGQQLPNLFFVVRSHHVDKDSVLRFALFLLIETNMTTDKQEDRQDDHSCHRRIASEMIHHRNEEAENKGCTGSDKPTAYHTEYPRDAEYRTLPAPCPVRQRSTHSHHKSHIGGGEGKPERSTEGDEQSG